jgi:hypothetical protein
MRIGERIYMRDQMSMPSWPPLLALIKGARSWDLVQVGYRWIQTLTSLGLLGLRVVMSTHASILEDSVGPPSAEVCRTAASFP